MSYDERYVECALVLGCVWLVWVVDIIPDRVGVAMYVFDVLSEYTLVEWGLILS